MKTAPILNYLLIVALTFYPAWRILKRAGFNSSWAICTFVPALGPLILILLLAFSDWPVLKKEK